MKPLEAGAPRQDSASFERVVIPVDRSALSESAIPVGIMLAQELGSSIDFLHVVDRNTGSKLNDAEAYLADITQRFPPPNDHRELVHVGEPEDAITNAAGDAEAMVVMATHGYTGLRRMILGSVADAVIRQARVPIVLVRADREFRFPPEGFRRLLVPIDGSERSARAAPLAAEIAQRSGGRLDLLHVVVPVAMSDLGSSMDPGYIPPEVYASMMDDLEAVAREDLEAARRVCEQAGVDAALHRPIGTPVDSICRLAEEAGADAIVLSTHGRGGASRVMMGSVATSVIHRCHIPVIIIPPQYGQSGTDETAVEAAGERCAEN
ncbi:MAG TPA: universal stress protein [Thermomicrobiales bacterium]|nr:universal stress protein [Thermomicrobiales bacterium]